MAALPAQTIRALCTNNAAGSPSPLIEPFNERQAANGLTWGLGPCTYDFRIAQRRVLLPYWALPLWCIYKLVDLVAGVLRCPKPFEDYYCVFALASTIERVWFPNDVCGVVLDKSSWARRGLAVQNTKFDPGFHGYPTLELSNHSLRTITIGAGTPICQFKFERLEGPTELPYHGRYQAQGNAPTPAKVAVGIWE
jgi:dCTP deaminase